MRIVITGASRGLGHALASSFIQRGDEVVSCSRSGTGPGRAVALDLSDPNVSASFGTLELGLADVLVCNAAVANDALLVLQSEQDILSTIQVNLISPTLLVREYFRTRLAAQKTGTVIFIGSIAGMRGIKGLSTYGATKGALSSLTASLAREMGPAGFRINTVVPGYFDSELSASLSPSDRERVVARTPLKRLASVEDVCPLVLFLASDASSFITGQSIVVDGGAAA